MTQALLPILMAATMHAPAEDLPPPPDFGREIQPILADACFKCHGPDGGSREADLRLDLRQGLFGPIRDAGPGRTRPGEPTRVVDPGSPERSELARRIASTDLDVRMPPPDAARQLTGAEIELLRQWIAQGAPWSGHWAFESIEPTAAPPVRDEAWSRNEIDNFVLAAIEARGLAPSPEGDSGTLIRRLSLDLTGLPPTLDEVGAFLGDESPDAYERLVDRLLASPRFGEHFAASWLDAARYADSNGFQLDPDRTAWPWRDWVVQAFNDNMPFDRFTREQIAGDLLPGAAESQILATAFNRNHPLNGEGGRDPEESRIDYVNDRVDATSTVWLGLTMACAQCHDHKYDPISQREYYQLAAYFNSIDEDGSGDQADEPPLLELTRPGEDALRVMVMRDRPEPRATHLLIRGGWDARGETVEPATPAVLDIAGEFPPDRRGLADWITDPANPLTARVAVNRLWQQLFGAGLVRTPGNFGLQGERPTHPDLLDYLASRFVESGWDVKAMLRLIVTSATYRQVSDCPPALRDLDPENRLLARAPRYRLPAAVIRDQALAASGLLVERLGGPPVKPYHPGGVWEDVSFGRLSYTQGSGDDLYRRSLYTFWRRTAPPANMFDTSMRQTCSVRVIRTNTPLHALVLMNDPTYTEAAAALAERAMREGGDEAAERIAWAFETLAIRPPTHEELRVLAARLESFRIYYDDHSAEAAAAACSGERPDPPEEVRAELAALAGVMSIILNLDETLTRE